MISIKGMFWLLGGEETGVEKVKGGFRGHKGPNEEAMVVLCVLMGAQGRVAEVAGRG